ncbi:hypothetical protein ONZ45_g717 [Pleurotus djamor]|nr:hypothetical protein ONZ45_g717 [Pleurotus djamor]
MSNSYHIFSLPTSLLDTLSPRSLISQPEPPVPSTSTPDASVTDQPLTANTSRSCNICLGVVFPDVDTQRNHFRSDWHRYNVKLRINGAQQVLEKDFAQLVDTLEDSLSGSESSSEGSESESDAVNTLVQKSRRTIRSPSPSTQPSAPVTAITWFHSPPSTQIGVYRSIFTRPNESTSYLSELKAMQVPLEEGRTWAMFMVAGGHFAGAIVRVSMPAQDEEDEADIKRKKHKKPKPETEVLRHKTFHRYTTRRKQGGSQSVNDNAKGPAKSAGALLRRYGEQALQDDIRNLLGDWAEEVHACERIWIRASTSNRKIFMDYDGSVLTKTDERMRTFPFPTRRPTQSEITRCLAELTRVKVTHLTEEALREQDEAYLASLPKPKPVPVVKQEVVPEKPKKAVLSKEEEIYREKWLRLLEMIIKGRLEPLKAFWEREGESLGGINASIPEWAGEKRRTLLQVGAHAGQAEVVKWLLEEANADPTIDMGELDDEEDGRHSDASDVPSARKKGSKRTAYDLARSTAVREVFRRCAGEYPDKWDWLGAAHVPSALSKQMEDERDEKKKVRRKGLKERVKEREAKQNQGRSASPEVVEMPPKVSPAQPIDGPQRLGGSSGATQGIAGLSPEMRAKVERERRARAAEARLKALGG